MTASVPLRSRLRSRLESWRGRPGQQPGVPSAARPAASPSDETPLSSGPGGRSRPPAAHVDDAGKLHAALRLVGRPGGRRVVLVTHPDATRKARRWLRKLRRDRVTVVSTAAADGRSGLGDGVDVVDASTLQDLEAALQLLGPIDIIVMAVPTRALPGRAEQYDIFLRTFLYLAPGGAYLLDRTVEEGAPSGPAPERWQGRLLAPADAERRHRSQTEKEIARALGTVAVSRELLLATKRKRHLLKIREHEVDTILPAREPDLRVNVLARRSGGSLVPRFTEHSHGVPRGGPWPERLDYPELSLRHYEGSLTSTGGTLLVAGDTVLPDSFRWPQAETLVNPMLRSTREMARVSKGSRPKRTLEGHYYFLDSAYSGHFGHLTSEVVPRLWGWDEAKRQIPDLKAFFYTRPHRPGHGRLERTLFSAFGIAEEDLVGVEEPVSLRSVVSASPMWQNQEPFYAHPDLRETWSKLTAGLLAGRAPATQERIFVSRGEQLSHRRGCRNQAEVEQFFADRGFHVFYPEELPLQEQVALFAGARVVAGFGGSAMLNLMHSRRLEATIVLSHHGYAARNEHLVASIVGGELHYFWSPSDVPPPEEGRTGKSDRSSWAFDFSRFGTKLDRAIAEH